MEEKIDRGLEHRVNLTGPSLQVWMDSALNPLQYRRAQSRQLNLKLYDVESPNILSEYITVFTLRGCGKTPTQQP